mgnify:CR=1 FL=1
MKKRVKLSTTIASLCLAVALMAFGVYAAVQTSFTINSTISFTSTDVALSWTLQMTGTQNTSYDQAKTVEETPIQANVVLSAENNNLSKGTVATFTMVCTNASTTAAETSVTFALTGSQKDLFTLTATRDGSDYTSEDKSDLVDASGTKSVTYIVTLALVNDVDAKITINDASFSITAYAAKK